MKDEKDVHVPSISFKLLESDDKELRQNLKALNLKGTAFWKCWCLAFNRVCRELSLIGDEKDND